MAGRILIDGDGCPVVDITIRIATGHNAECLILCDSSHYVERDGATTITIAKGADAVDFAVTTEQAYDCCNIAVRKEMFTEDFFDLSSGLAGEIAQKLVNYGFRLAIIGDFSGYTSKSLKDFIYESNKGRHLYFVANEDEALKKLGDC